MRICPVIYKDPEMENSSRSDTPTYTPFEILLAGLTAIWSKILQFLHVLFSEVRLKLTGIGEDKIKLAQKRNLSNEEIAVVLSDSNPIVRLELAWNSSISSDTLRSLLRDPDRTVAAVARRRLIKTTDQEIKLPNF